MKKIILLLAIIATSQIATAQNVGIGTTTPITKLEVLTPDASWGIIHTNGSVRVGTYAGSAGGWIATQSSHPLYFATSLLNLNGSAQMALLTNGNFGIGNIAPAYKLDIHSTGNAQINMSEGVGFQTALFSRYTNRLEIQPSDAFQVSVGGIDQRNLCISNNGYTGIGTSTPSTRLQVLTADGSYGITHTNGTVSVGTYIGNGGGWLGTQSNHPLYFFTNNSNAQMTLATNGNFGIGAITPVNKLQIGAVGGYIGNDIAFGNGTQASGIAQNASVAQWYSTTDIALMPKGNGHGRVGINTTTPKVPLEVDDYVITQALQNPAGTTYDGFDYFRVGGYNGGVNSWGADVGGICHSCNADVSIYAYGNVMATEFDAISDARMKDVKGLSNTAKDLATINAIEITDYTLKDKVKSGNKPFKKVIAQQVETVYPEVVSRHVDFIPDVYQVTDKINKTDSGCILRFECGHHLSKDAKRIKLLAPDDNSMKQYNIVAILSDKEVLIDAPDLNENKVFVYGEEVSDFRTVDYEGLTTLNISATQELSKLLQLQQKEIDELKEEIKILKSK